MRIRKVSQTTPIQAQVVDGYSTSQIDSYSANYVNNTFELKGKIIWTNSNPTNNFDAQTITLDESLDNYDCYEIVFKHSMAGNRFYSTGKIPVGHGTICFYTANERYYRPTSDIVSGSSITFENSRTIGTGGTEIVDNSRAIPVYVIGYNTGLFE